MAKIFITGIAGFISSHLAESLIHQHQIFGVDNFETGKESNISHLHLDFFKPVSITSDWMDAYIDSIRPDIIIHAAASYKDPNNWMRDADTNVRGTAWLCYLAKKYKVKKIIYFQTSLCYGLNPQGRFNSSLPLSISFPVNPAPNSYAITKTAAEQIIAMSGIPFVSLRLANIYGPRTLTGAIPTFYKKIKGGEIVTVSDTRRDFVYVDDLVKLVGRVVDGEGKRSYYHVSTGRDYVIYDIFSKMDVIVGKTSCSQLIPRKPDDTETILLDCSQTMKDFTGWIADTPLDKGLTETIKWYEEHGVSESYTHLRRD